jgi:nicotinic acid mononucleotide adenylyltransferase
MMLTLDQWREPDEIFKLSYPVYIRREKDAILDKKIVQKIADYNQKYGKVVRRIVTEPIELSSNLVRERLASGESISHLVPALVEKYIRDNHLYE